MKKQTVTYSIIIMAIIVALVALICYAPTIAKNRFMDSLENDNFQATNEIFEKNQENALIKDELGQIINILEGKIDTALIDLYEEKADLNKSEELSKLYINLASFNGLSTEKGEELKSAIDMYREIDAMKECIKEGKDFEALGKGLISTAYVDVEAYAQVLSRSIDEFNKGSIVAGIDSAIDYHISRAEGNYTLMKAPALIAKRTVLSNILLDDAEYNKLIEKINAYNQSRMCAVGGCDGWTKSNYCEEHKCEADTCSNLKKSGFDYCAKHICAASGCDNYNYDDTYCGTHECNQDGCKKYASNGDYCSSHAKKSSYSTSNSNSGIPFTNKYGSRTTRCVVSGCSKYIATSGDTNCCTSHSNKCGNCGCYIDGDAMFCMSCLVSALG